MTANESNRVRQAYARREGKKTASRYSLYQSGTLLAVQERERVLLTLLGGTLGNLGDKRILDIGCGTAGTLLPFVFYGATPQNCYGVDLLEDRIAKAKERSPGMHFVCCSAEKIPLNKESFHLVTMFTCLSSVLDNNIRKSICHQAMEMLRPSGWVLVYDFYVNNPYNSDVKAVKLNELKGYFPRCLYRSKKLTLLPPLSRRIAKYSKAMCVWLNLFPFLRTHRMTMFQKPL